MYERHFGIAGPPFRLNPDPDFYFDSTQHGAVMGALRQAFEREPSFVMLSGEIGAGKTTLLRAWTEELVSAGTAVGQIANTQLDADELVLAVSHAFGIPLTAVASDDPEADMRTLLRSLKPRPALLIVDEAQNLGPAALRRLLTLADVAIEEGVVLRICLAGQPELRALVAHPAVQELDSRLQHAGHLEPLDADQTRRYIEHRLHKVGWTGTPSFDAAAFDEIHRFTEGVPRRVNVFANRLMLSQYLANTARIDVKTVIATAHALHAEIGEEVLIEAPPVVAPPPRKGAPFEPRAVLVLASGRSDLIKAVPLLQAMGQRSDLPPASLVSLASLTAGNAWRLNRELHVYAGVGQQPISLADDDGVSAEEVESAFERFVDAGPVGAVVVFDGNDVSRRCAEVARKFGVPIVHVGADPQAENEFDAPGSARAAIGRIADLHFDCQAAWPADAQAREADHIEVGSPLVDAVQLALRFATRTSRRDQQWQPPPEYATEQRGYGVLALKQMPSDPNAPGKRDVMPLLRSLGRDLPFVWPMRRAMMLEMRDSGLARLMSGERIACIEELGHTGFIRLVRHATCVLTDSFDVMEEAAVLGVPCLSLGTGHAGRRGWIPAQDVGGSATRATRALWDIMFNGTEPAAQPELWDGEASSRIAAHLAGWLANSPGSGHAAVAAQAAVRPPEIKGGRSRRGR